MLHTKRRKNFLDALTKRYCRKYIGETPIETDNAYTFKICLGICHCIFTFACPNSTKQTVDNLIVAATKLQKSFLRQAFYSGTLRMYRG